MRKNIKQKNNRNSIITCVLVIIMPLIFGVPNVGANTYDIDTIPSNNSISGFFWLDGNGDLETDWDGLYNGDERPLVGYPVHLYASDDLSSSIAATHTDFNGTYIFEDLAPGSYILGVVGKQNEAIDLLMPVLMTSDNRFAIDWRVSGLPAYTEVIELEDGQSAQDINAGIRVPMGTDIYDDTITEDMLSSLAEIDIDDSIDIPLGSFELATGLTNIHRAIVPSGVYSDDSAIVALALTAIAIVVIWQIAIGYIKRRIHNAQYEE
ncbi:MAG: hypothetical protein FWH57_01345 [Oscillospiraceae bacterium]|nr:hypothetical protein [Oscillospiraceae bacterium]